MKFSIMSALAVTICVQGFAREIMTNGSTTLTADELRPVLAVISRLAPVRLSRELSLSGSFSICFSDDQAFKELNSAFAGYKGNVAWILTSRPPFLCLAGVPEKTALEAHRVAGYSQLRELILQDVPSFSSYLERQLRLIGMPSKGVNIEGGESPVLAAGESGPGGPALLVSDPGAYIANGFRSTSSRDRTVDFWMSEQELEDLFAEIQAQQTGDDRMPMLLRVSEATHENLIVRAEEVALLKRECEAMAGASQRLKEAMLRVIRICNMAEVNNLSIVVVGG